MLRILGLAALCLLLLTACGERRDAGAPASRAVAAPDSAVLVPVTAADVHAFGARTDRRVTVVNLWATWCEPCREEMPELLAAVRAHERDGVRLALVSADFEDQQPAVRKFLAEQGWRDSAYVKHQDDMTFINGIRSDWSGALPATLVLDSRGRVRAFWSGKADRARFERAITEALTEGGAPTGGNP